MYKKFANSQVKTLITRYLKKEIGRKYIQEILGLKKTRFFALIKQLKEDPENFSISYSRKVPTRKISKDIEKNMVKELKIEKDFIKVKEVPTLGNSFFILPTNISSALILTLLKYPLKDFSYYLIIFIPFCNGVFA